MTTTMNPLINMNALKPYQRSTTNDHNNCLQRRLELWLKGEFDELMEEGRTIQQRLRKVGGKTRVNCYVKSFTNLMLQGKTTAAIKLLFNNENSGILELNAKENPDDPTSRSVLEALKAKHPNSRPSTPDSVIFPSHDPPSVHPIIFERIDAVCIRTTVLRTFGAGGPSQTDAHCWRRICSSFNSASNNLCWSLAIVAKRLCSEKVDPEVLAPFLACRLIALDKQPGVRPIGICEVPRRIIAKAILSITKQDVLDAAGLKQLCAGQVAGVESAIHVVRQCYDEDETEGVLLVDASNAFNSINREAALLNVRHLCPPLATVLLNCYRDPVSLFVDGSTLLSEEGTTQGDPLAMPFYALATTPLIQDLSNIPVQQTWYADDAAACGKLLHIRKWWEELAIKGPAYGYFPNAAKTWLVVKSSVEAEAKQIFSNSGIQVTSQGRPYLGSPLGSPPFIKDFVSKKVSQWKSALENLNTIARSQPHVAYAALTHGLSNCWSFICRTTPKINELLKPIDEYLLQQLIPTITGRPTPSANQCSILSLPTRMGGMNTVPPSSLQNELRWSQDLSSPLTTAIRNSTVCDYDSIQTKQEEAKKKIRQERESLLKTKADRLNSEMSECMLFTLKLAQEKGASSWLNVLPIQEHGFHLHKSDFRDAVALRYGWTPPDLPSHCACGKNFTVDHVLSCAKGGFPTLRHNELRDLTASLLTETCANVTIEPPLQKLDGETFSGASVNRTDGARVDIAADNFWGDHKRVFLDVKVFNPHAPSYRKSTLPAVYTQQEKDKKRHYQDRIREVELGSFSPLVFAVTGGMAKEATMFYKRMASYLADKWAQPYSITINWLRCRISYSLLRSSIRSLRGARSAIGRPVGPVNHSIDLIKSESMLRHE